MPSQPPISELGGRELHLRPPSSSTSPAEALSGTHQCPPAGSCWEGEGNELVVEPPHWSVGAPPPAPPGRD